MVVLTEVFFNAFMIKVVCCLMNRNFHHTESRFNYLTPRCNVLVVLVGIANDLHSIRKKCVEVNECRSLLGKAMAMMSQDPISLSNWSRQRLRSLQLAFVRTTQK